MRFNAVFLHALLSAVLGLSPPLAAAAQRTGAAPAAADVTPDKWPKLATVAGLQYTIYQPQLESWDGYRLTARVAVSILSPAAKGAVFGVVNVTAKTEVDRQSRVVRLSGVKIVDATFPSAAENAAQFQSSLQDWLSSQVFTPSLDRMEAALAVETAATQAQGAPVANDPPRIVFSEASAALVYVDGEPVWRQVEGTPVSRVLNSRAFIATDASGKVYLRLLDGFVEAASIAGPWTASTKVPAPIASLARTLAASNVVDMLEGAADAVTNKKPSLKAGVPRVLVVTSPTELVMTDGAPNWSPIAGTALLYVSNTTGNVFKSLVDQQVYVLVSGRWFKAGDFTGAWQYVDPAALPADFTAISDESPKENVKASIPGTRQAQDAVIANQIPQTARVYRSEAKYVAQVNGAAELRSIPGTTLSYVFNAPTPIIRISDVEWYAEQSGVWFVASALTGPWAVAATVPGAIYAIPPSSPVHYVTYVKVYDVTPTYVVVGYTPGYMGTIVSTRGVVVYGTGYAYVPYIGPGVWYGPPVTYGYAANPTWTPWTGWAIGFGIGWAVASSSHYHFCYVPAPYWGPMPYSPYRGGYAKGPYGGAVAWGPGGWAATTGNVYQRWGTTTAVSRSAAGYNAWTGNAWSSKVGTSYNSTTGRISAGQKASVSNVYTGNYGTAQRGASYNPNTGVAVRAGSVSGGNAYTGANGSAKGVQAVGPNGQRVTVGKVNDTAYAGKDGNVYKNSGDGWQKYDSNGGWTGIEKPTTLPTPAEKPGQNRSQSSTPQSLDAQQRARQVGDQRSASTSWGSESWGGGFGGERGGAKSPPVANPEGRQSWGGGQFGGGAAAGGGNSKGGRGRR